ncbi:hypothetical protein [Aquiflexum gelatinilyticum]|uniref:hypothetical protein n=1 Tax=Aquiflexum gelatinilyticum TaxID=2961943 RepID=UPI00216937B9|nr:hypothetical protein [Aquiflexum gelatinilyticum]MCS4435471.1 hypothetical protein [Aquiflexum gelatinilyticum]
MKKLLIIGMILCSGVTNAQDMFQEVLFSADLVFQNSFAISLTDKQADKITKIYSQNFMDFRKVKWDLDEANVKLRKMLKEPRINSEAVSKQLDLILGLENLLKKKQLLTLVAIKNELSETQQKELQELKEISDISIPFSHGRSKTATEANNNPNVKLRLSANSENSPLMLLSTKDGIIKIADINKINPDDIQSLEVLKDKFLIDKYGEKAKNGVVIITLKKDKQ